LYIPSIPGATDTIDMSLVQEEHCVGIDDEHVPSIVCGYMLGGPSIAGHSF
jgi:hypothetical protein